MAKLETSLCLGIVYTSTLPAIQKDEDILYLKKYWYQDQEVFGIGVKMPRKESPNPAFIFVLTTNYLQQTGHKIKTVITSAGLTNEYGEEEWTEVETEMKEVDYNAEESIQFFPRPLRRNLIKGTDFNFCVTVHFTGVVPTYQVQQMDDLLSDQLWLSVTDQLAGGAILTLIATDGGCFSVHKWMLAARSPVFAALLSTGEDITSLHLAIDCTKEEMKQFNRFIYTGELKGLVSQELLQLAIKYEIKTLEEIGKAAIKKDAPLSTDKMTLIDSHMKSAGTYFCKIDEQPIFPEVDQEIITSIFTCTWNMLNLNWTKETEEQDTVTTSVPFDHEGQNLFRAELEMRKYPEQEFNLKFICLGHGDLRCGVLDVICYTTHQEDSSLNQQIEMKDIGTHDMKHLRVYSKQLTAPLSCPFVITFKVRLWCTIPTMINKMIDSTWSKDLWAASVNRKMTDVEFLVGEEVFGAHRSLVSARSPVFAAMFASGMKEAVTGQVRIEDTNPTTFQHFLKFLYTGMFDPSTLDKELFIVADKYGVETLMELCRPTNETVYTD